MATQNLGNVRALIRSATAPTNTNLLWRDTSVTPPKTKEYDDSTSTWIDLRADATIFIPQSEKGVADGVATLDMTGRIPSGQLPASVAELKGTFGSAQSTTGGDLPSTGNDPGDAYFCDTDNYVSAEAGLTFDAGDLAIYDTNNAWVKRGGSEQVQADYAETNTNAPSFIRNKPFTTTQEQRLRALVYEEATATLSRNIAIFERGLTSATTVAVTWAVTPNDDLITSVNITNLTGPFGNSGTQNDDITNTTTWMMTVVRTDADGNSVANIVRSVTSTAVVPKFYGVSTDNTYPTVNPYTDLNKLVQTSSSISSRAFSPTNQYVWFITTKATGIIRDGNGFDQTADFNVTPISLVLPDSTTVNAWTYVTRTTKTLVNFNYELI